MSSSAGHQPDCANASHQSVIEIDPDGDLTLVVGRTKTRFLVCSKALSRSASFWKCCLYGPFKEAKPMTGQDWVVEFPEDNPSALKCLLLLVHGLGYKMPKVDLQLAFEITVLTNKYDMTRSLWAFAGPWLKDLKPDSPDESGDDTIVPQLQWLWLTKELGDSHQHSETFAELSQMVSTTTDGNAHLLLSSYICGDARTFSRHNLKGYDAEKDVMFLFTDKIKDARKKALSEIQTVLTKDIKALRVAIRAFDSSKSSKGCTAATICAGATICNGREHNGGSLHPTRRRLYEYAMKAIVTKFSAGKDSAVKSIPMIYESVEEYLATAVCFISRIRREIALVSGDNHKNCTPFTSKLPSLNTLKGHTLYDWWKENSEAFKMQAQVSGLEKSDSDGNEGQGTAGPPSSTRKRSRDDFEAPVLQLDLE